MITVVADFLKESHRTILRDIAEKNHRRIEFYDTPEEARTHLQETEILFAKDTGLIKDAPRLKWNCTPNAGADEYCRPGVLPDHVLLTNSSGAYGVTISEHIIMVILELLRCRKEYAQIISEKRWIRYLPVRSIHGSRIAIIGTGDLGTEAAHRLKAFSPAVITGVNRRGRRPDEVYDRIIQKDKLNLILKDTDIVVMCLPGGEATYHYLDEKAIACLPRHAIVINVGRGSNIDQKALIAALNEGRIAGAALDVFEEEPIPGNDPAWNCRNLLITPHISGNMTLDYTVDQCISMFCEDLNNYFQGRPLRYQVDRRLGY